MLVWYIENVKGKVRTRNNLLHKLTNSSWVPILPLYGVLPLHSAIQLQNTLALSIGEIVPCRERRYPPQWQLQMHHWLPIKDLQMLTAYIILYVLAGIAPPGVRRSVASRTEFRRQAEDTRHPCHAMHEPAPSRLISRKSFLHVVQPLSQPHQAARLASWEEQRTESQPLAKLPIPTNEQL